MGMRGIWTLYTINEIHLDNRIISLNVREAGHKDISTIMDHLRTFHSSIRLVSQRENL